jgi:hypothetical protein
VRFSTAAQSFNVHAIDELGDQILRAFELAHIVDCEDVRVVERRRQLCFALEAPAALGVGEPIGQELDTGRSSFVSTAPNTTPIPPSPSGTVRRYPATSSPDRRMPTCVWGSLMTIGR